jgi:hypothetical protein
LTATVVRADAAPTPIISNAKTIKMTHRDARAAGEIAASEDGDVTVKLAA